jgi:hypothetical protein
VFVKDEQPRFIPLGWAIFESVMHLSVLALVSSLTIFRNLHPFHRYFEYIFATARAHRK